jgi:hypothetical protein
MEGGKIDLQTLPDYPIKVGHVDLKKAMHHFNVLPESGEQRMVTGVVHEHIKEVVQADAGQLCAGFNQTDQIRRVAVRLPTP